MQTFAFVCSFFWEIACFFLFKYINRFLFIYIKKNSELGPLERYGLRLSELIEPTTATLSAYDYKLQCFYLQFANNLR